MRRRTNGKVRMFLKNMDFWLAVLTLAAALFGIVISKKLDSIKKLSTELNFSKMDISKSRQGPFRLQSKIRKSELAIT